jgi:hypothetical protein
MASPIGTGTAPARTDQPVSPPASPAKLARDGICPIIVLDWDDTVLPTTHLTDRYSEYISGSASLPDTAAKELAALEEVIIGFLEEVLRYGKATIITNAMTGKSVRRHMLD